MDENWDNDFEFNQLQKRSTDDTKTTATFSQDCDDPPSASPPPRPETPTTSTENWDDDFEDNSPLRKPRSRYRTTPRRSTAAEDWDDELEKATPSQKRARVSAYSDEFNSDEEFGIGNSEDDLTLKARSKPRRTVSRASPPPPLPAVHDSVFSLPRTNNPVSPSHIVLPPLPVVGSTSCPIPPPSPPRARDREHRKFRRKSKDKSNTRSEDEPPAACFPLPPTRSRTPSPPPSNPAIAIQRSPLLNRIGSVKRWGVKKNRESTGPPPTLNGSAHSLEPPRAPSPAPKPHWFFRSTSPNRSSRDLPLIDRSSSRTPEMAAKLVKRKSLGFYPLRRAVDPGSESSSPNSLAQPLPPNATPTQRSASVAGHGESSSMAQEGSRGFMGGVRKLSLVNGGKKNLHTRTKSAAIISSPSASPVDTVSSPLSPPLPSPPSISPTPKTPPVVNSVPAIQPSTLLPPIELSPPSPPTTLSRVVILPSSTSAPAALRPRASPGSPGQAASLGRSAFPPPPTHSNSDSHPSSSSSRPAARRSSLGDLKIPVRISQAQTALRRDLVLVREFAACVDQLKELQATYLSLLHEAYSILDHPARAISPSSRIFSSRKRSHTNPPPPGSQMRFTAALLAVQSKYRLSWECAELLIELGGSTPLSTLDGNGEGGSAPKSAPPSSLSIPSTSVSAPVIPMNRERAITLTGDEGSPLTKSSAGRPWRASTGRNDLSQRQLTLLKEMLANGGGGVVQEAEEGASEQVSPPRRSTCQSPDVEVLNGTVVDRAWKWGSAMGSTITLPDDGANGGVKREGGGGKGKGRKGGMSALRDMLRSMKRSHQTRSQPQSRPGSSMLQSPLSPGSPPASMLPPPARTPFLHHASQGSSMISLSTTASSVSHSQSHHRLRRNAMRSSSGSHHQRRRRAETSSQAPTSARVTLYGTSQRPSPRRPSLATIFKLGQKSSTSVVKVSPSASTPEDGRTGDLGRSTGSFPRTGSGGSSGMNPGVGTGTGMEEEDWDRMDSASDVDHRNSGVAGETEDGGVKAADAPATATLRARGPSPYLATGGSRSSIFGGDAIAPRGTRLSNVDEGDHRPSTSVGMPSIPLGKPTGEKTGLVRSNHSPPGGLALTPENIAPLLDNAKEVCGKLVECVKEVGELVRLMRV